MVAAARLKRQGKEPGENEERNYQRLVKGHNQLKSLSGKLGHYMEQLWKIHSKYIKPFEKTDDTYRKKWKNFLNDFKNISLSYLKTLAEAFITTVVCVVLAVQAPFVLAGILVALAVGIVVMIAVPEESVPDWMKGAKEAADGVKEKALKIMKDGPVVIVESIGQGFMDKIQSPAGIAAVAGTVTGMLAGGMAGKKINTKLSAGKGVKVDGGIDSAIQGAEVTGMVQSRINIANGPTRFTPVRPTTGKPVSAGFKHVLEGHFNRPVANSRSVFSITPEKLKAILQNPATVKVSVKAIPGGQYVRTVNVGEIVGYTALKFGGKETTWIKIFTDRHGNLITTFPIPKP